MDTAERETLLAMIRLRKAHRGRGKGQFQDPRRWLTLVLLIATACGEPEPTYPLHHLSFRVRSDVGQPLNLDAGWAGQEGENVAIGADRPFRIRFEVARPPASSVNGPFRLQYRRNGGEWSYVEAHDFPKSEASPRVSIVATDAYTDGAPTTNLLTGSSEAFLPGVGISLDDRTPPWTGSGYHGEFEWPLVIRRFVDDAVTNDEGDVFEFRMVEAVGLSHAPGSLPVLRLVVPPHHLGGTFVETPGRIGPWKAANGDLHAILEPAETSNLFTMVESRDNGLSWSEVDGSHRPNASDLEAVDARQVGDRIHILHQVTEAVWYHCFFTSDHPTRPNTWATRDELVATLTASAQATSLVVRSDGSMVAFFVGANAIHVSVRAPGKAWGDPVTLARNAAGPQAVLGSNDVVHVAYYGLDGTIWYQTLDQDGRFGRRQRVARGAGRTRAHYGAVLPLLFDPDARTVVILYQLARGHLWERRIVQGEELTPPVRVTDRLVVHNAVDSQQPGADAVMDRGTVHVLFIDRASRDLFRTHDRGGWQPSRIEVSGIEGAWVRGSVYDRPDGRRVYGFIYDAGSRGGSGMNRFSEVVLEDVRKDQDI